MQEGGFLIIIVDTNKLLSSLMFLHTSRIACQEACRRMLLQVISVDVPNHMELVIAETGPGVKGNTVSGGTKEAILETGARILVMHTSWPLPNALAHAAYALTHIYVRRITCQSNNSADA